MADQFKKLNSKNHLFLVGFLVLSFWSFYPARAASSMELFWHANTLVPDNFLGRSLPIRGSIITVIAIGEGDYRAQNYTWYLDRKLMKSFSGISQNSFSFRASEWPGFSHNIQVKIGEEYRTLNLKIYEPEVSLGQNDLVMSPGESRIFQAFPYYFTNPDLEFTWAFNNSKIASKDNPEFLELSLPADYPKFQRKLDITVVNPRNFLERATKRIVIKIE